MEEGLQQGDGPAPAGERSASVAFLWRLAVRRNAAMEHGRRGLELGCRPPSVSAHPSFPLFFFFF